MPTQDEYNIGFQSERNIYAKIRLVNTEWQELEEWESAVVGTPTFTIDSTSAIRRTCSLTLSSVDIDGNQHAVRFGKDIWLNTYFQIHLGVQDVHSGEIIYTNMGIYMIDNPTKVYSATDNTFTIKGVDLMCRMTGLRNGSLEGVEYIIEAGTNVRTAIISTIALAGFTEYVVEECPYDVQEDINIDVGGTIYDILEALLDIYPNYQMYFDTDGVFHYEQIPTGTNEQISVDDDYWENNLISISTEYDFESVKNSITVIGKTHDIKYFGTATVNDNTYEVDISTLTSYRNNIKIGFVAPTKISTSEIYLSVSELGAKQILDSDGATPDLEDEENIYYVVKYQEDGDYLLYMGQVTPTATVKEENPDSPFYVEGELGEIRIVLSGGEYDNIYTNSLALARAKYELYNRCRLMDNITITTVPILWLDVNQLIRLTIPEGFTDTEEETSDYLITSISTTFGETGTQTIVASKYYAYYGSE